MTKPEIWELLQRKFPAQQYALMAEVRDAAGFSASRSADYMAMSLWPSRGLGITGIELKSFRSDWLNELKKPQKAEAIFQYCDYFYLLTSDDKVANPSEIPDNWGWMCIKGKTIKILKEAPKLSPVQLSRDIVSTMLKRAIDKSDYIHKDSIEDRIQEVRLREKDFYERTQQAYVKEIESFKKTISTFEEAAGVQFGSWGPYRPEIIGKTVKFISENGVDGVKNELTRLQTIAQEILNKITKTLETQK